MNGKDLEKALLWEAPHIGEKAPEQIPEAQDFCEGYKTFLNEGKTERECVKKAVTLLENAGYQKFDPEEGDHCFHNRNKRSERGIEDERCPHRFPAPRFKTESAV